MAEYTREQKLKILDNLPADLQAAFTSDATAVTLSNLKKKYSIPNEKTGELSKIVGNVILGILPLTGLSQELNSKITPDMQIALHLAQDLNVDLFFPVMESLKQAPVIANAVLTGQPIPTIVPTAPTPAPVVPAAPVAPAILPIQPKPQAPLPPMRPVAPVTQAPIYAVPIAPKPDQYREPAEVIAGPLKPKIGPETFTPAPKPVMPPVVTLRPLEMMIPQKPTMPAPTPAPLAPKPVPAPAPMPAPMPAPQPIKVPLPTPSPQPAPIKIPVAPAPMPAPAPAPRPTPVVPPAPRPLTFTRPVMPSTPPMPAPALAPASMPASAPVPPTPKIIPNPNLDTYREPVEFAPLPVPPQLPTEEMAHPQPMPEKQFINSPVGPMSDLEEQIGDIIDLRQDKGRF